MMNRRQFLINACKKAGGGLLGFGALQSMGVSIAEAIDIIGSAGGGACDTEEMAYDTGTSESQLGVASNSLKWRSTQFTYTGTNGASICAIELWVSWSDTGGSSPRDYTFYIYDDSSGEPGSSVGNSDALDFSDDRVGGTAEWYKITLTTPTSALTNGNTYHIVATAIGDENDYLVWHGNNDQPVTRNAYSSDGLSWTVNTANAYLFRLYS